MNTTDRDYRANKHRTYLIARLLKSTAILCFVATLSGIPTSKTSAENILSGATGSETKHFDIEASALGKALVRFADLADLRLLFSSDTVAGLTAAPLSGTFTNDEALSRLLSGTGLSYRFNSANTVTIIEPGAVSHEPLYAEAAGGDAADERVIRLDKITVAGTARSGEGIYGVDAPVAVISEEMIDRFRGHSPADIFRGTPGVMSGEARNGAGAIDVNIRGMQGLGRVAVTVDGASNSVQIYQGYQGISNRTFVDPDLLAGIDITKGADIASNGIAGTVAMRTLDADDIVWDGKKFGARIKLGFGTNTSPPPPGGTLGGYEWPDPRIGNSVLVSSEDGLDRPGLLEPTSGSGSLAFGFKSEPVDFVMGLAYRNLGNYHAGENGTNNRDPDPEGTGVVRPPFCPVTPRFLCSEGVRQNRPDLYVPPVPGTELVNNRGQTNYRPGEEVLNTELETLSFLGKGTFRFADDHTIKFTYNGFRSEAGDIVASRLVSNEAQPRQLPVPTGTDVDAGIVDYSWQPKSPYFDVDAKLWGTFLHQQNQRAFQLASFGAFVSRPEDFGFPADFRIGTETLMWGADVSNTSRLFTDYGDVDIELGLSYQWEETQPDDNSDELLERVEQTNAPFFFVEPRDGEREEAAGYGKLSWSPWDWVTAKSGLRYQHYWSRDRYQGDQADRKREGNNDGDVGYSLGLTLRPLDGIQLYSQYASVVRSPSLFEVVNVGAIRGAPLNELSPERSNTLEIGANLTATGLMWAEDRFMTKLGYFDSTVDDYIAREFSADSNGISAMRFFNAHEARFAGFEVASRYEYAGFTADLAANYYTDVSFCRTNDSCDNRSLNADYSTNQIPPKYSINLTVSQTFFNDRLTIGGRASHFGERAIEHGDGPGGSQSFITQVEWGETTLFNAFAEYELSDNVAFSLRGENLTDQFYIDPLSLVSVPGPGRTIFGGLTVRF